MTRMLTWCVICLLFSSSGWSQTSQKSEAEKAVEALEQRWLRSQQENNPDLIAPSVAEKFVATQSDGKVIDKTEMLASAKASQYRSAEYGDLKVTVFGNAAIVTGFEKIEGNRFVWPAARRQRKVYRHVGEDAGRHVAVCGEPTDDKFRFKRERKSCGQAAQIGESNVKRDGIGRRRNY